MRLGLCKCCTGLEIRFEKLWLTCRSHGMLAASLEITPCRSYLCWTIMRTIMHKNTVQLVSIFTYYNLLLYVFNTIGSFTSTNYSLQLL